MSITLVPYTNNYVFARGRALIGLKNAAGLSEGLKPVGNAPEYKINIAATLFEHPSSESGLSEIDFTTPKEIKRTSALTIDNLTDRNLALFIAGQLRQQQQSATPVVNERIARVTAGGHYQLGRSVSNFTGVRHVSAVTVNSYEGRNTATRVNSTPYTFGQSFKVGTNWFLVISDGATAAVAPAFITTAIGDVTVDGSVSVMYMGLTTAVFSTTSDITVDAPYGLIGVRETGLLATMLSVIPPDASIGLAVDYTPRAGSRSQILTGDAPSLKAEFKFISDNPSGTNRDVYCPDVTITPNGDLTMITGGDIIKLGLNISINKLDSATPAMIIDNAPTDL